MPAIDDFFYVARGRQLFVGLRAKDPNLAAQLVPTIMSVSTDMPGVMTMAFQSSLFEQGLTAGRTIDLEITGPDIRKLVGIGGQIFGMLPATFPETTPDGRPAYQAIPRPSLDLSSPELHVTAKAEQAEDQGIRTNEIGYAVNALVDGAYATDYYHEGDKIDLSIVGGEQFASRTQDLEQLWIATPTRRWRSLARSPTSSTPAAPSRSTIASATARSRCKSRRRRCAAGRSARPHSGEHHPAAGRQRADQRRSLRDQPVRHRRQAAAGLGRDEVEPAVGVCHHLPRHGGAVRIVALSVRDHPQRTVGRSGRLLWPVAA